MTGQGKKKAREAPAKKWDLGNHTSSGSLTYLAGNLNNRTATRNDHTARLGTEPTLNRSALKPLALGAFQLTIPSYQYLKFTYALNGQWSSIKLFVAIPDIGTKTEIPITVNVDGQTQSEDSLNSGDAFMYSHSFDISGAKRFELDLADIYGYSTVVIVAGDLSH
jgi:hypothetical protein